MKLLIITQAVDSQDQALGFFIDWIREFAKDCEKVTVICQRKGEYSLPANVSVFSLGKENSRDRLSQLIRFKYLVWTKRAKYDTVFVHMNPEYIVVGGPIWKLTGKKILFWYTHRSVTWKLRIATFFADTIFSSSPESFRLKTNKVHFLGHGIDMAKFPYVKKSFAEPITILHVGRITPIKDVGTIFEAIRLLREKGHNMNLIFIGAPIGSSDENYVKGIHKKIHNANAESWVTFKGSVPYGSLRDVYRGATISINATPTGGTDKVVLESLASGLVVFASNLGLKQVFGEYSDIFLFDHGNPKNFADKIEQFLELPGKEGIVTSLSQTIRDEYSVQRLISRILNYTK